MLTRATEYMAQKVEADAGYGQALSHNPMFPVAVQRLRTDWLRGLVVLDKGLKMSDCSQAKDLRSLRGESGYLDCASLQVRGHPMTTITFDIRKAVRNLQAAGFPEAQADAIANVKADLLKVALGIMVDTLAEAFTDTVATKPDIVEVKTEAVAIILPNATLTFGMLRLLLR